MKLKTVAIAVLMMLGLAGPTYANTVRVGVSTEPYPPFYEPTASGGYKGWEIDIIHAICADQHMDCVIKNVAWDGLIPALKAGQIDAIMSSMSITAAREKVIDFSNKYYESPAVIVANKSDKIQPTPKSLAGKTIGIQISTNNMRYARKYFPGSTLKGYQTQDEADQDLAAGRIDATLADKLTMQAFVAGNGGSCCEIKGDVAPDQKIFGPGLGAGIRKGDTVLKAKINKGITDIRANGTYAAITKKYFSFDIY